MYKSKIKEQFRGRKFSDKEYWILFDIGESKVMLYDDDRGLIYDLFKNKLEKPQGKILLDEFSEQYEMLLVAKYDTYKLEYNLDGVYELHDYFERTTHNTKSGHPMDVTNLIVTCRGQDGEREIFPSRFKVYALKEREVDDM